MIRILFVDDDSDAHSLLRISLPRGYTLISGHTAQAGIRLASQVHPDVVLLDVDLPDATGFDVLDRIHRLPVPPPVIMLTGFDEIQLAVKSIRAGATNYIAKPYQRQMLLEAIREAARCGQVAEADPGYEAGFMGDSRAARDVRSRIRKYAATDRPVLITGESGTGKDLSARLIHELSGRRNGPFITRNCGAIPTALVENELFGSERGAFTDAATRPGSFELADAGTLFLDELGEMPAQAQVKLLRALEERMVQRIGARQPTPVDVRIVSATNRDVSKSVADGDIRKDLFYRVSTLRIHIPPLRDRRDDVPVLVQHKLRELRRTLTPEALSKLARYDWPGNIRELHHVLERAAILSDENRLGAGAIDFG